MDLRFLTDVIVLEMDLCGWVNRLVEGFMMHDLLNHDLVVHWLVDDGLVMDHALDHLDPWLNMVDNGPGRLVMSDHLDLTVDVEITRSGVGPVLVLYPGVTLMLLRPGKEAYLRPYSPCKIGFRSVLNQNLGDLK